MIDYSKMTDLELSEAAALAMGCNIKCDSVGNSYCGCGDNKHGPQVEQGYVSLQDYAGDLNHAAEFMAFVSGLDSNGVWRWCVEQFWVRPINGWLVKLVINNSGVVIASSVSASLARAETIACLTACDAIKKGG